MLPKVVTSPQSRKELGMEAKLIKIDRNGSKHFEGYVPCDRCGGTGGAEAWKWTGWTCYKCGGTGKVWSKWIERTPEYQAKLDAKREAKREAHRAEEEAKRAEWERKEAQRKAEEEKRKAEEMARKAISQYVGEVGKRITINVTYLGSAHFEVNSFRGYGTETMYVHTFKDESGNKLIWKTSKGIGTWLDNGEWLKHEEGEPVEITGTVKEHKEYREEKQTALNRCKLNWKGVTA